MGDPTVAELLSIPDPNAAAFNPANGVRRSMRTIKSKGPQPEFVDHEASVAKELTEAIAPIAPEAKRSPAKRLHPPVKLRAKSTTSRRTEAPEPQPQEESEVTGLESPLKKAKLTKTTTFSSRRTVRNTEAHEDESVAGEPDEDFVPTRLETAGAAKTPQLNVYPIFLASPQLSDEARASSPKKRSSLAAKQPKRTPRKTAKAKLSETVDKTVDPMDESTVARPPSQGKPLVWAEVCLARRKNLFRSVG